MKPPSRGKSVLLAFAEGAYPSIQAISGVKIIQGFVLTTERGLVLLNERAARRGERELEMGRRGGD